MLDAQNSLYTQRYQALFENSNDAIFIFSLDYHIIEANQRAADLLGYESSEELIGLPAGRHVDETNDSEIQDLGNRLLAGEMIPIYERRLRRRDGAVVDVEINVSLVRDAQGKPKQIQSIIRDITGQKQMQGALAKSRDAAVEAARLKSEFLATMSHEIRTPLNAVIGMTELLLDTSLDDEQREYGDIIYNEAHTLHNLIAAILDFSKLEAGRMILDSHHYDLRKLVKGITDSLSLTAQGKGLTLTAQVDPLVPAALRGDSLRLRQVIVNLLSNAVKFTHEGEVTLTVACIDRDTETMKLRFTVRDTGIGIPAEMMDKLHEPFVQADGSNTRRYGGTGLGLAIVRGIIDLMESRLEVESKPGEGSRFAFEIIQPIAETQYVRKKKRRRRQSVSVLPDAPLVLIVEDDEINGDLAQLQLRKIGFRTQRVRDGLEAMRLITSTKDHFAAILMDCQMPVMDGFEATRQLRADGIKTPIIAMTANTLSQDREKCIEAGMDDYISKPVNLDLLHRKLSKWLT